MLNIGCDLDGVLNEFWQPYVDRFGTPKDDAEITRNCQRILSRDKHFWENLPLLHKPNFTPKLYCTKRTSLKSYAKNWMIKHDIPIAPIYQVLYQYGDKSRYIKGKIDIFIDDSIDNFITINRAGIPCLLMDSPVNQHLGPMLRIYSLDIDEIYDAYFLGQEVFENFNMYYGNR